MELTQDRLKEVLKYNTETGDFTWKITRAGCRKEGFLAGSVGVRGYRRIMVDGVLYRGARLAFMFMEGYLPENDCDHINRNKGDDRWSNLRHVSRQCNSRNSGRRANNTSGVTGVHLDKRNGHWIANIKVNWRGYKLGSFPQFIDAVRARWEAEVKHDWPGCNSHTDAYCYLHGETV